MAMMHPTEPTTVADLIVTPQGAMLRVEIATQHAATQLTVYGAELLVHKIQGWLDYRRQQAAGLTPDYIAGYTAGLKDAQAD
jgi:hypothetical protein